MVTPLYIEIALFYACTAPAAGDFERIDAPACREAIQDMQERGLLELKMGGRRAYEATFAMQVWVNAMCATPFPVQQWVIPKA